MINIFLIMILIYKGLMEINEIEFEKLIIITILIFLIYENFSIIIVYFLIKNIKLFFTFFELISN